LHQTIAPFDRINMASTEERDVRTGRKRTCGGWTLFPGKEAPNLSEHSENWA
jgi:hypothetical protein